MKLAELFEQEPDAGLGNGGLGRLAACFVESLATMAIPAIGYGLRYDYGIFRQEIRDGSQVEHPDHWLSRPDPWEVVRPNETVEVPLGSKFESHGGMISVDRGQAMHLLGIPYDRPVVGYGGLTINTLRLWQAATPDCLRFRRVQRRRFLRRGVGPGPRRDGQPRPLSGRLDAPRPIVAVHPGILPRRLLAGRHRSRFLRRGNDWPALADKVAIQLNDTHPAMAVAELMRILLDRAKLGWEQAWDLTVRTLAYTNHTLLPEALEKWPVELFEALIPRQLEIIYEINRRFLDTVVRRIPETRRRFRG